MQPIAVNWLIKAKIMRIAHLSDIHLSSDNLPDLRNIYLKSLIADIDEFQKDHPIDALVISGDLVDKGGASFSPQDPYDVFEREFIKPIQAAFNLSPSNILFVPGNHDIDRSLIVEDAEYFLANKLNKALANKLLAENRDTFTTKNQRIAPFKNFEKRFHEADPSYIYSNNEFLFIFNDTNGKIGFALINDSWRSSAELEREQHFFGANQLFNAKKIFDENGTDLNVAIFHHPLDLISQEEKDEVENILESQNFHLALYGHTHRHRIEALISSKGGILTIIGRSAFNKSEESIEKYQPGYSIIDLDARQKKYKIFARKFIRSGFRFDKDVDSLPEGETSGTFEKKMHYALSEISSATEGIL